jgi:hypothetical protein
VIVIPGDDEAFEAICLDIDNIDWIRISHTGKATLDIKLAKSQIEAALLQGQKVTTNKMTSSVSPDQ